MLNSTRSAGEPGASWRTVPFPPQKPKPFDRKSVESLRSGLIGCYGLFRKDRWVYIGKGEQTGVVYDFGVDK